LLRNQLNFQGPVFSHRHGNDAHSLAGPRSATGETSNAGSIVLTHRDDCLSDLEWRFADDRVSLRSIKERVELYRLKRYPMEPYSPSQRKSNPNAELAHGISACRPGGFRPQAIRAWRVTLHQFNVRGSPAPRGLRRRQNLIHVRSPASQVFGKADWRRSGAAEAAYCHQHIWIERRRARRRLLATNVGNFAEQQFVRRCDILGHKHPVQGRVRTSSAECEHPAR
jgi:hypothetical protein